MTFTLTIGRTQIPYEVLFSPRARLKRIVVTPERVQVVAPRGTPLEGKDGVFPFVHTKRRWMFDAVREIGARHRKLLAQKYASGAKLQYRGRWLMLDVQDAEVECVEVAYRSKFHVRVPLGLGGSARTQAVQQGIEAWLQSRARDDVNSMGRRHARNLGVDPKKLGTFESKHVWGSCWKDGQVRVHWRLIQAPKVALEYVVAHELTHLLHRNHSREFWRALGTTMPNWEEGKAMLERWEGEHRAV